MTLIVELKPETVKPEKIRVEGLEVTIADEATFLVEATGEQLSLEQYLDYTRRKVVGYVPEWARLWEVWVEPEKRQAFLNDLRQASVHEVILALLDKYRVGGVDQLTDPRIFRLSPFREMGQALGVLRRFGGAEPLQKAVQEVQQRLYAA